MLRSDLEIFFDFLLFRNWYNNHLDYTEILLLRKKNRSEVREKVFVLLPKKYLVFHKESFELPCLENYCLDIFQYTSSLDL